MLFAKGAELENVEDPLGLPAMMWLCQQIPNKWEGTQYLMMEGIIKKPEQCPNCGSGIGYKKCPYTQEALYKKGSATKGASEYKACFTYRCKNRKCSLQQSIYAGTFFANGKKPVNEVIMCFYLWLKGTPIRSVQLLLSWSEACVLDYFRKFRVCVSQDITNYIENEADTEDFVFDSVQIGGPGIEVQIDESAFGKNKYGRGHYVDTKWVFGGVEIVPDAYMRKKGGPFFAVVVPNRKKECLDEYIKKFIRPGSIIWSDSFATYKKLSDRLPQYEHEMVNHKKQYKSSTGVCTNTVEGKWNKLKKAIPKQGYRSPKVLQEYLGEQMWRNTHKGLLWEKGIDALTNYVDQTTGSE